MPRFDTPEGVAQVAAAAAPLRNASIRRDEFWKTDWSSGGNWIPTFSARRETGGWMRMKESCVEGVAAHDGPESCVDAREGGGEALTEETAGWVLNREILKVQGADAVEKSGRLHGAHRHGEVHAGPAAQPAKGAQLLNHASGHDLRRCERPARRRCLGRAEILIKPLRNERGH